MYMGMVFLCASTIEILLDNIFILLIDRPCWIYHVWPVHNGYTSGAMMFIWPWYGFHLYFFHKAMKIKKYDFINSAWSSSIMVAVDAMFLETIVNTFTILIFNGYYFYYLGNDLFHFTSIEVFVPYFVAGLLLMIAIHFFDRKKMPRFWIGIVAYLLAAYSILVLG